MDHRSYHPGDVILFNGLYRCSAATCRHEIWCISGRRFPGSHCRGGSWQLEHPSDEGRFL